MVEGVSESDAEGHDMTVDVLDAFGLRLGFWRVVEKDYLLTH